MLPFGIHKGNPAPDLAGYLIYASDTPDGQILGKGNEIKDIAAPATSTMVTMPDGDYYFIIMAYDDLGNEAIVKSAEIHQVLDETAPGATDGFAITVIIKVLVP